MARSLNDIQEEALNIVSNNNDLNGLEVLTDNEKSTLANLTSTSRVSIWRLMIWVQSFMIFLHEKLWDVFKADIEARIASSRIHTRGWYREKALAFRFGQDLINETDTYGDTGLTAIEIENSKIIKHAAIVSVIINGYGTLRAKVAKEDNGDRVPLNDIERTAFFAYMNEISDAGTAITVTSFPADDLKLVLDIYYDPLVLDAQGRRLDGTNDTPVLEAANTFTRDIKFDGEFIKSELKDDLKKVEGVVIPVVKEAYSKFGQYDYTTTGIVNCGEIDEIRVAEAGYIKLDQDNTIINYISKND